MSFRPNFERGIQNIETVLRVNKSYTFHRANNSSRVVSWAGWYGVILNRSAKKDVNEGSGQEERSSCPLPSSAYFFAMLFKTNYCHRRWQRGELMTGIHVALKTTKAGNMTESFRKQAITPLCWGTKVLHPHAMHSREGELNKERGTRQVVMRTGYSLSHCALAPTAAL